MCRQATTAVLVVRLRVVRGLLAVLVFSDVVLVRFTEGTGVTGNGTTDANAGAGSGSISCSHMKRDAVISTGSNRCAVTTAIARV